VVLSELAGEGEDGEDDATAGDDCTVTPETETPAELRLAVKAADAT